MLNMKQNYIKFVKYFVYLLKNKLFKHKNKINNIFSTKLIISNFNKYIIVIVSFLFIYLFYLSIPTLYDKSWVQATIEKKLIEEFKINFSTSSQISYDILPSPHFKIKNVKIFNENFEEPKQLAEIKDLKIFIDQKNFFNKEKLNINKVLLENTNFSFNKYDLKFLNKFVNSKFSKKKIKISKSSIFYKNNNDETLAIIKIPKVVLFHDDLKILNILNLRGEVFNIPFNLDLKKDFLLPESKEINFTANKIKLNFFNKSLKYLDDSFIGSNIISILNLKLNSNYTQSKNSIMIKSKKSKMNNSNLSYNGKFSLKPFDLNLDINIDNYKFFELFTSNSIFFEFIQSNLLFNENISANISIAGLSDSGDILSSSMLVFNVSNGKISFDNTKLINDKIGLLDVITSNLLFEDGKLILKSEILIDIKNLNNLFRFIQTPKELRKKIIKKIIINLDYDFVTKKIEFNSIKVDGSEVNDEIMSIVQDFSKTKEINLNKSRRVLNKLFSVYDG